MVRCVTLHSLVSVEQRIIQEKRCKYNPASPSGLVFLRYGNPVKMGTLRKDGYWSTQLDKKNVQVHRIVWVLNFGSIPPGMEIDHINRNPSDNRIENLRLATRSQNGYNRKVPKQSRSGERYVHTCSKTGRFVVKIGKKYYGTYGTLEEAMAVRDSIRLTMGGTTSCYF